MSSPSLWMTVAATVAGVGAVVLLFEAPPMVLAVAFIVMTGVTALEFMLLVVEFLPKSRAQLYVKAMFGLALVGATLARCVETAQALASPVVSEGVNFEDPAQFVIRAVVFAGVTVGFVYYYTHEGEIVYRKPTTEKEKS